MRNNKRNNEIRVTKAKQNNDETHRMLAARQIGGQVDRCTEGQDVNVAATPLPVPLPARLLLLQTEKTFTNCVVQVAL